VPRLLHSGTVATRKTLGTERCVEEGKSEREREGERERECVCVCVCDRERERCCLLGAQEATAVTRTVAEPRAVAL